MMQRTFTKMLCELPGFIYRERFDRLGSSSLERQRLRRDLIEVYKIRRGADRPSEPFSLRWKCSTLDGIAIS